MRVVKRKHVSQMNGAEVAAWAQSYKNLTVDLGAGDGRFVHHLTSRDPDVGAIGVDLCEANLRAASRTANGNALFVVADALALPAELSGVAAHVSINFPWGSLLRGLLAGHPSLLAGLNAIGRAETSFDILVNAGALEEAGWTLEAGGTQVIAILREAGFSVETPLTLGPADLRARPTTWAKRLAFGRDPRALHLSANLVPSSLSPYDPTTPSPITHHPPPITPVCYSSRLAGAEPVSIENM